MTISEPALPRKAAIFNRYIWRRLFAKGRFRSLVVERLSEPLHMNAMAVLIAVFGSFRQKVDFDLIVRPQFAFPILFAADFAKRRCVPRITIAEFGVASGAGLINMCNIAASVTKETGIQIDIVGFDTGTGMPKGLDYRDHPECFQPGDFPMNADALRRALPSNAKLVLGPIRETVKDFIASLSPEAPLAFISVDVDYYSSAVDVLKVLEGSPNKYLPIILTYLDDIRIDGANPWCGELLAVQEFNASHALRKIAPFTMLRSKRLFKNPRWIDQIYMAHIFDHRTRTFDHRTRTFEYHQRGTKTIIPNEWIE